MPPARHRHAEESAPAQNGKPFCAGVFCFFQFFRKNLPKTVDKPEKRWYNNQRRQGRHTSSGGLAQLGERLHGMQEVSGSIPLFSTKKALYFVGSTVLFFLLKLVFGDCIASPAPFLGFCRRFLYNPQLLTLHRFQKGMFAARFFSRLLHHPLQCTA